MKKTILLIVLCFFSFTSIGRIQEEKISYLAVYNLILESGIEFPDIVFAQSVCESGHYKSKLTKLNNNIFGMRLPMKRPTDAIGKKFGYAVYEFWQDSVFDYLKYQELIFKNKKLTRQQYLNLLDRTYASAPNYSQKLLKIIKEYKHILYTPPADRNDGYLFNNHII